MPTLACRGKRSSAVTAASAASRIRVSPPPAGKSIDPEASKTARMEDGTLSTCQPPRVRSTRSSEGGSLAVTSPRPLPPVRGVMSGSRRPSPSRVWSPPRS